MPGESSGRAATVAPVPTASREPADTAGARPNGEPGAAAAPRSIGRRSWLGPALVVVAALAFFLVNVAHFGHQPLRIEEQEWPSMAKAIYHHGEPVLPWDESYKLRLTADLKPEQGTSIGAWHPPLYLYALAGAMVVVGTDASYTLRGVGVAGFLLACVLLLLIARAVTPRRWPLVGAGGVALLLVHPYAIQGSTFLDIDTSLYAPAVMLVLWLAVRFAQEKRVGLRQIVLLGLAVALVGWLKLTTTIVLVLVLALWWVLARGPRRGIPEIGGAIAVGVAAFFGTYALWCAATGIPFSYTFDYTFAAKSGRLLDTTLVEQAFHWHVEWFMPALLLLVGAYGVDAAVSFWRTRRARALDLLWGFGIAVLLLYVVVSPTDGSYQGKYAFSGLVALSLPISWLLLRDGLALRARQLLPAIVIGLVVALLLPDLLTGARYGLSSGTEHLRILAASAAALLLAWRFAPRSVAGAGVTALVACGVLLIAQSVRSYQADVSPMYPAPDTVDFENAIRAVKAATRPGDAVFVPKDMGFYLQDRRVIEGEDQFARGDEVTARALRTLDAVSVVATDSFGPPRGLATQAAIDACFQRVTTIGTATVRERTPTC
jgi:hypothetical protein